MVMLFYKWFGENGGAANCAMGQFLPIKNVRRSLCFGLCGNVTYDWENQLTSASRSSYANYQSKPRRLGE